MKPTAPAVVKSTQNSAQTKPPVKNAPIAAKVVSKGDDEEDDDDDDEEDDDDDDDEVDEKFIQKMIKKTGMLLRD